MPITLHTPRLTLRPLTDADADNLRRLSLNPNVFRFLGETPLADDAAALEIIQLRIAPQYRDFGVGRLAVDRRDDGRFVGWCGLKFLADTNEYDLGYRFFEEEWGQGFATESAGAVIDWARRERPGIRLVGQAHVDNAASIRVLHKLGFTFTRLETEDVGQVAIHHLDV